MRHQIHNVQIPLRSEVSAQFFALVLTPSKNLDEKLKEQILIANVSYSLEEASQKGQFHLTSVLAKEPKDYAITSVLAVPIEMVMRQMSFSSKDMERLFGMRLAPRPLEKKEMNQEQFIYSLMMLSDKYATSEEKEVITNLIEKLKTNVKSISSDAKA